MTVAYGGRKIDIFFFFLSVDDYDESMTRSRSRSKIYYEKSRSNLSFISFISRSLFGKPGISSFRKIKKDLFKSFFE